MVNRAAGPGGATATVRPASSRLRSRGSTDANSPGATWERTYPFKDVEFQWVEVTLTWSDDEGTRSEPDIFELHVSHGREPGDSAGGPGGELLVSMNTDSPYTDWNWTITVVCNEAGMTPLGPIGVIGTTDPGNSWRLEFTYTYAAVEVEPPEPPGPPPNIAALYDDPIFWTHVAFMIASTYMFGLVGLLAGVVLFVRRRWADDPNRWKRALATNRPFRALSVHAWWVFLIAAIPLGMYVAGKAYGWENAWTSFPAVWNPWFYDITNADNVSLIVLVLWAIPLWLNRQELMASRPHVWFFGRIPFFRRLAAKAPEPMITDREMAIIYFLMGVFVFLLFVIQPHGN